MLNDEHYRFLAADGSTCTYFSTPSFSPDDYYCTPGHSIRGFYSMHLNAFFDLTTHTYTDALIQPAHSKNEFGAFCDIVDRHVVLEGRKNVYIGDRGYCSYNNLAHVIEQNQNFLLRTKDIHSKGLVAYFDFQEEEYELTFRIVRFLISESTCECIVTNLLRDVFPAVRIKELYHARWGIFLCGERPHKKHRMSIRCENRRQKHLTSKLDTAFEAHFPAL